MKQFGGFDCGLMGVKHVWDEYIKAKFVYLYQEENLAEETILLFFSRVMHISSKRRSGKFACLFGIKMKLRYHHHRLYWSFIEITKTLIYNIMIESVCFCYETQQNTLICYDYKVQNYLGTVRKHHDEWFYSNHACRRKCYELFCECNLARFSIYRVYPNIKIRSSLLFR